MYSESDLPKLPQRPTKCLSASYMRGKAKSAKSDAKNIINNFISVSYVKQIFYMNRYLQVSKHQNSFFLRT